MLKGVKKGIKKKIKGKKDKKEDDLFDPEQLEKYKRELEEAKKARQHDGESGTSAAAGGSAAGGHEEDEEWLRFKQLTSGVDAVVNKVAEDLDRIKESSFFQRNKPSEQNKLFASERPPGAIIPTPEQETAPDGQWVNTEGVEVEHALGDAFDAPVAEDATDDPFSAAKVPESPEIDPVELDDSLFDTTFVDAVATGEIKLAYIPDSPTKEEGDDPFDTSAVADVVKRIEEEEKRQKKQVNLGVAVDVLTGKADKTGPQRPRIKAAETKPKARPRPHAVNLLGDFDDASLPVAPPVDSKSTVEKPKDLFDQILDSPSKDASSPLLDKVDLLLAKATTENQSGRDLSPKDGIKDVISEFDIISQLDPISGTAEPEPLPSGVPSSIPSSIAALLTTAPAPDPEEDELDDEFAALAAESLHKGPSEPPALEKHNASEPAPEEEEEDPFDTSFVEKTAAHGKCELKILEDEFLGEVQSEKKKPNEDDDDFDFNPRLGESPPKTLQIQNPPKANPLEDESPMASVKAPAIQPHVTAAGPALVDMVVATSTAGVEDVDPFDTSSCETALPGKVELKLLEAELLSSVEQARIEPPKLPEKIATALTKTMTQDDDFDFDPRQGEIQHHPLDLPTTGHADDTASKVLTPQQELDVEIDPFDTSAVAASGLIPGPLELRLLEDELVTPTMTDTGPPVPIPITIPHAPGSAVMTRTFSDEDFDPRCGIPAPVVPQKPPEDIFDSAMDFAVDKPMTPQMEAPPSAIPEPKLCSSNLEDPFDTSAIQIENYLAKSELKQVEEELLNAPHEPLPQRKLPVIVGVEFKKSHPPPQPIPKPEPPAPHILEAMTPCDDFKPLTPVEVPASMSGVISVFNPSPMADPFDTSIAEGVIPGKTEIKLLEDELGVTAELNRSLSDDDFNPREPNHPSKQMVSQPLIPTQSQVKTGGSDPFDTSTTNSMLPGKAELKALEAELL